MKRKPKHKLKPDRKQRKKRPSFKRNNAEPMDNATRQRKFVAKGMDLSVPEYDWADSDERVACERDLMRFCKHYLPQRFPLEFSDDQREAIDKIQFAALTGGQFAQSAPRGDGKTQRVLAGAVWAALYGHRRYIVPIGATAERGKSLVREIIQELADNDALAEDWPEICLPIRKAYAKPNRAHYITVNGEAARLECAVAKLVLPSVECCKDRSRPIGGVVVEGAGITAAFRGLRHTTAGGETLRPELAILDDVQTRKSAMSIGQTDRVMQILRGDIKRLAGPDKELAVVCNCTVVRRGDAADQLLDNKANPQWRGVRKKMVYEWPKRKDLWDEYARRRKAGLLEGDGGRGATEFYKEHRTEMDEGGRVGWAARYRRDNGEHSAIQCAYNILIDDGEEAFAAECQNEPLEKVVAINAITPAVVCSRLNGLASGAVPELARFVTAFVDINPRRSLAWAAVAWHANLTGSVIGYGLWPADGRVVWSEKQPGAETEEQAIFRNLSELAEQLMRPGAFGRALDRVLVDVGHRDVPVFQFLGDAHNRRQWKQWGASRGSGATKFRPQADARRVEWAYLTEWAGKGHVLIHDADWHRMKTQQAFTIATGSPGSLSVFGDREIQHHEFAKQICAETLTQFFQSQVPAQSGVYQWTHTPAQWNEWLDCVVGCRVAACFELVARGMVLDNGMPAPPAPTPEPQDTKKLPQLEPVGPVSYDSNW